MNAGAVNSTSSMHSTQHGMHSVGRQVPLTSSQAYDASCILLDFHTHVEVISELSECGLNIVRRCINIGALLPEREVLRRQVNSGNV